MRLTYLLAILGSTLLTHQLNSQTGVNPELQEHINKKEISIEHESIDYIDTCVTIQPGYRKGKDALLHGLESHVDVNYGTNNQFAASAWTFGGIPGDLRSVVQFDLAGIPEGTEIISARLSFYGWDTSPGLGQHSTLSGSNISWLQRITSEWIEEEVTWNTQPTTTAVNQVSVPESVSPDEDYIDIDVTNLVQDMVNAPSESFGFMLRLQNESYYRLLNFVSSDHPDDALHPKIEICYLTRADVSIEEQEKFSFSIFPNPTKNEAVIEINNSGNFEIDIEIYNMQGTLLRKNSTFDSTIQLDLSNLSNGTYIINMSQGYEMVCKKLIINE